MIRRANECNVEYREHMRDSATELYEITNFIGGPESSMIRAGSLPGSH